MNAKTSRVKASLVHYTALFVAAVLAAASVVLHKDAFDSGDGGASSVSRDWSNARGTDDFSAGRTYDERLTPKSTLAFSQFEKSQKIITTLVLDGDLTDEQVVVYQNENEFEGKVFLTQIKFDPASGEYVRMMNAPSAANIAETVSLLSNDLVGDHSVCILLSGMNSSGEHTLTVFRKPDVNGAFEIIGEFIVDGIISVVETERGVNYERGITNETSFPITTRGRDPASFNEMDRIETTYTYNSTTNRYEQDRVTAIPGAAIENQWQRDILSGNRARFQEFISGLWYLVSPEGTVNARQYVYIDPEDGEIIFYADDRQEVFSWINATPTRYGLYLVANNIALTTLRRYIDIELESRDSIRLKVIEDVRMKIEASAPWDGSYRKMPLLKDRITAAAPPVDAFIEKEYESTLGRVSFNLNGEYRIETDGAAQTGKYAFFLLGGEELLELRPASLSGEKRIPREVYAVARDGSGLVLSRVRIGIKKIERYREASIALYVPND
ncbi:MAG: pallilysin-related adhesin [Spirochaetaceae bacterium]|jgi:hypothetical protein|nr:pallilysin-related adhesin [Spirochaetaceae bacterium]